MNKAELVAAIADASELTKKDAQAALTSFQKVITKLAIDSEKTKKNVEQSVLVTYISQIMDDKNKQMF